MRRSASRRSSGPRSTRRTRGPGSRELRMPFEELRARGTDQEERRRPHLRDEVLDEGEQSLVGPVQVLEDEHGRLGSGELLQEARPSGEVLLAIRVRRLEADQRFEAIQQPGAVGPWAPAPPASQRRLAISSSSRMPACALTISARAQKEMPSP